MAKLQAQHIHRVELANRRLRAALGDNILDEHLQRALGRLAKDRMAVGELSTCMINLQRAIDDLLRAELV